MNPFLYSSCYIPDPEAHLRDDGRLYIYGSLDNPFWVPMVTLEFDSPDLWTTVECDFPETEGNVTTLWRSLHAAFRLA